MKYILERYQRHVLYFDQMRDIVRHILSNQARYRQVDEYVRSVQCKQLDVARNNERK
jgi:hypothetical protein